MNVEDVNRHDDPEHPRQLRLLVIESEGDDVLKLDDETKAIGKRNVAIARMAREEALRKAARRW